MAAVGALQPIGSDRGLGRSCPNPVVARGETDGFRSLEDVNNTERRVRASCGFITTFGRRIPMLIRRAITVSP